MIVCDAGDILLVPFPFSESEKVKKRPALLLYAGDSRKSYSLATIAMISSQIDSPRIFGDVFLEDWSTENLLHPSIVRLSKIATLDRNLILSKIGTLTKRDVTSAKKEFKKVYSFWL